jgi:hypothetical protein
MELGRDALRSACLTACLALLAAPALAQGVPYQQLLETGMNVAAENAGWKWEDAKQGFNVAGAGNGFAVAFEVEVGKTYLLATSCAAPCTKAALMLTDSDQQRIGDLTWGEAAGDIHLATRSFTAETTGKLLLVAVIGACGEATCPGGASVYATKAD